MLKIDFKMPRGWHELTPRQIRYLYSLLAAEFSATEIMAHCLLRWNGAKILGRRPSGAWLLRLGKISFSVSAEELAVLYPMFAWLTTLPEYPVRPERIGRRRALPADMQGVPFETFIIIDNLYQGYLQTRREDLLDSLAEVLYPGGRIPGRLHLRSWQRVAIFYWIAGLKSMLAAKYSHFLRPSAGDGMLAPSTPDPEQSMNAQIRALTKGDITKEAHVLSLDTHRALNELDAQAREYEEFNKKYGNNRT